MYTSYSAKGLLVSNSKTQNEEPIFSTILVLLVFFIAAQIFFFMHNFHPYFKIAINSHTDFSIPSIVVPNIVTFVLAHIGLYAVFSCLLWFIARGLVLALELLQNRVLHTTIGVTLFSIATLLWCNQAFYPNSQFSLLLGELLPSWITYAISFVFVCTLLAGCGVAFYGWFKHFALRKAQLILLTTLIVTALLTIYFLMQPLQASRQARNSIISPASPNIILIGIDSLRPDHLQFFGSQWTRTPNFDQFLAKSLSFEHAVTPYGRTFPAWVSILSGLYPPHHGARYNLINPNKITAYQASLPKLLQSHEYQTFFATDENRFSNIDQRFYFDKIVGPKMGFNDFLLGSTNDFPLSNLIINTRLGQWLFPYTYANRAAAATYNPKTFLTLLKQHLTHLDPQHPAFIAIHLCLPHWPYLWHRAPVGLPNDPPSMRYLYQKAINRADQQFKAVLSLLKQQHFLDKAWVVLLSDHAEGLDLANDLLIDSKHYSPGNHSQTDLLKHLDKQNQLRYDLQLAVGHGTNVLSSVQFHPVLAFRAYGMPQSKPQIFKQTVSLIDIKPTVTDLLKIKTSHYDGVSLKQTLTEGTPPPTSRDFYFESALLIDAIKTMHPNLANVIKQGLDFYRIDSHSGHLVIRDSKTNFILGSKQQAVHRAPWYLARYPIGPNDTLSILVNTQNKTWTDDLNSEWAQQAPVHSLLNALNNMYGNG